MLGKSVSGRCVVGGPRGGEVWGGLHCFEAWGACFCSGGGGKDPLHNIFIHVCVYVCMSRGKKFVVTFVACKFYFSLACTF